MDDPLRDALVVEVRSSLGNGSLERRRDARADFSEFWLSATGMPC